MGFVDDVIILAYGNSTEANCISKNLYRTFFLNKLYMYKFVHVNKMHGGFNVVLEANAWVLLERKPLKLSQIDLSKLELIDRENNFKTPNKSSGCGTCYPHGLSLIMRPRHPFVCYRRDMKTDGRDGRPNDCKLRNNIHSASLLQHKKEIH